MRPIIFGWVAINFLTYERLVERCDKVTRLLARNQYELRSRQSFLNDENRRIERALRRLLDTVEITALTDELQKRLREWSSEIRQVETDLAKIERMLE